MEKKVVLITGIGGNVGQGIIRNIIEAKLPVIIIGCNITDMSAGNYLVDSFYKVPFAYEENYLSEIQKIVAKENVSLIIPSTDYEVYYLSVNQDNLTCKVACAGPVSAKTYLDKYDSYNLHKQFNIPFSESMLPSTYNGQYNLAIAKPREGRGSKGLIKDYKGIPVLTDKEYLIQPLHQGKEVTTAVYANYSSKSLHGIITMERTLENGATTYCKVYDDLDDKLTEIAEAIIKHTDICGAFNIQSIITDSGEVFPFEVNCRISGTNSIRSHFGFKDVIWTVEELLFDKLPEPFAKKYGFAHRILLDVIYTYDNKDYKVLGNNKDNFKVF